MPAPKVAQLLNLAATDRQLAHHEAEREKIEALNDAAFLNKVRHYLANSIPPRNADGTIQGPGYPSYEAALYHLILPEFVRRMEALPFRMNERLKPYNGYFDEYRQLRERLTSFLRDHLEFFPPEFGYEELYNMCVRKKWLTFPSDGGCQKYKLEVR